MKQSDKVWIAKVNDKDQPRYAHVPNCKYNAIFGSYNDWIIMTFVNKKTPDNEYDNVHRLVMSGLTKNMSSKIIVGNIGVVATNDTNTEGYFLVQFDSVPCPLQEDTTLDGIELHAGVIVCNAEYFYPAKKKS